MEQFIYSWLLVGLGMTFITCATDAQKGKVAGDAVELLVAITMIIFWPIIVGCIVVNRKILL